MTVIAARAPGPLPAAPLHQLRLGALLRTLLRERPSFWFLNLYMFFEYVRPQSIYTAIDVLPWGSLSLAGTIGFFVVEGFRVRRRGPADALLLLYLGLVLLSSVFAYDPPTAYENLYIFVSWVLVYFLITNIVVTEERLLIFMIGFLLYSFKMSQHGTRSWASIGFQFRDWGTYGAPGWFQNSGEFGIQMCIFFPIVLYLWLHLRKAWPWWKQALVAVLPLTALIGMVASSSRGALLGGVMVGLFMLARSRYKVRGFVAVALMGVGLLLITPEQQKARFRNSGSDGTSVERLEMWKDGLEIARAHPVLGIGYWNWIPYRVAEGKRRLLSHNIFIQCVSEIGYSGLLALLALIGSSFAMMARTRRRLRALPPPLRSPFLVGMAYGVDGGLVGFLVSGFFVTVLYYPFLWINLAMASCVHWIVLSQYRAHRRQVAAHRAGRAVAGRTGVLVPAAV